MPEPKWHYGPTEDDPEPAKRWHDDCGGEVWYLDGGDICRRCGKQWDDEEEAAYR